VFSPEADGARKSTDALPPIIPDSAALEDAVVGALVRPEAPLQPLVVPVERVRVLHDELADADEAPARPRLVAHLRLEVVEDLRQLTVRGDLARVEGHRLLVGHGEHEVATQTIVGLPELRNHVAAARLPQLGRRDHRHEHLLTADRVHLLPDDLDGLLVDAPAERKERPEAGAHLADEAAADEQAVARRLGIARILPERRDEELGRSRHQCLFG
jgi:hypothetical protein